MDKKPTIALLWNHNADIQDVLYWWDGLRYVYDNLSKEYDVKLLTENQASLIEQLDPDFILVWGGIDKPICRMISTFRAKSAFLYAGGTKVHENFNNFSTIFYESDLDGEEFEKLGYSTKKAFGTNTEMYFPQDTPKIFDVIYPAAFARWKRHELFAKAVKGLKALACGQWQPHEIDCVDVCKENGVLTTKPVHPEVLSTLYNASKVTVVTPNESGGCQRTVLESLASGTPVVATKDNPLLFEYEESGGVWFCDESDLRECIDSVMEQEVDKDKLHNWVKENYSEKKYFETINQWIKSAL